MGIHDCCVQVKVLEFKKHLVAALGHLGCFSVSIDCNSSLFKCPVNDLPSPSKQRNSMFILKKKKKCLYHKQIEGQVLFIVSLLWQERVNCYHDIN